MLDAASVLAYARAGFEWWAMEYPPGFEEPEPEVAEAEAAAEKAQRAANSHLTIDKHFLKSIRV